MYIYHLSFRFYWCGPCTLLHIRKACQKKDRREFYQLVKKHKKSSTKPPKIEFGEHKTTTEVDSWAGYYEHLATPQDDMTFDAAYEGHLRITHILQDMASTGHHLPPVEADTVSTYVKSLSNGKAPDIYGVASEHLKHASPMVITILTSITNEALTQGKLPSPFKLGILSPIPKKKQQKLPTNFRRITITSIVGKVVEIHMVTLSNPILDSVQSRLQFGFTEGCSPTYAALILTEIMADAADSKEELLITLMDTSKAFDVVSHPGMLNSLYQQGVQGTLWQLFNSMYSNIQSAVKWKGEVSRSFVEYQGIRQGAKSSGSGYKQGRNRILHALDTHASNHLGPMPTGALMVADDLTITSKTLTEMQTGITLAERDASRERYKFNTQKTMTIAMNAKHDPKLVLNGREVAVTQCEAHLGILRNNTNTNSDTIQARVRSARRATFDLLGLGYHGFTGTGPQVAAMKYRQFIQPILLYGLEALVLSKTDRDILASYHRETLRCIMHIPKSSAIPAIHLLIGMPPIEATLHIRVMTLLRSVLAAESGKPPAIYIRDLMRHQLTMKNPDSSSWAPYVKKLLEEYKLPRSSELLTNPPSKNQWRKMVKDAVHTTWTKRLKESARDMTSTQFLNLNACSTDHMHPVWQNLSSQLCIRKATVRVLLLIQRYPLATSPLAGNKRSDMCPLCKTEPETVTHFVLRCKMLCQTRVRYLNHILNIYRSYKLSIDPETLIRVLLDSTYLPDENLEFERLCRNFIFKIHDRRSVILGGCSEFQI